MLPILARLGPAPLLAAWVTPALAFSGLDLHVSAGSGRPPAFALDGSHPFPHVRTAATPTELYRAGDPAGGDWPAVELYAVRGPGAGEVTLHASGGCTEPGSFADGGTSLRQLHVATGGSAGGDGSPARPFATIAQAAAVAVPGDRIEVHAGSYPGSSYITSLQGTAAHPIWITGAPGEPPPVLGSAGVSEALHLTDPAFVVLQDLVVEGPTGNGINIDDGGDYSTPAHDVVVRRVTVRDIGTGGNQDCLKLSGLDHFRVEDCLFERCGGGGSAIDMVGCHRGLITRSEFRSLGSNAIQTKGGSADVVIRGNLMVDAGARAMNLGGSTGLPYFRPLGANYEARNIQAIANVVVGSQAPVAYVGCDGCLVASNTFYRPTRWVIRILQETNDPAFIQCRDGRFVDNLVVFDSAAIAAFVNIGPDTRPGTFTFASNLWFSRDDPGFSGPTLPAPETDPVIQRDPLLLDPAAEDFHLGPGSAAAAEGVCYPEIGADRDRRCRPDPPAIGAHEP